MKRILIILLFLFIFTNSVYGGENHTPTEYIVNDTVPLISDSNVTALEDGHLNTSFSDGSKGYCLEYMEQEASKGDVFYKVDTSYAVNNKDNNPVGNYLKLYFTEYTSHAFSDPIVCQHMIWHFTDNFNGWRVNYTIVDMIKNSSKTIPDYYHQQLNSTHERIWIFNVLLSLYEEHQDYFSYIFYDKLITDDTDCNVTGNETNNLTTNSTLKENILLDIIISYNYNISTNYNTHDYYMDNIHKSRFGELITGFEDNDMLIFGLLILSLVILVNVKKF